MIKKGKIKKNTPLIKCNFGNETAKEELDFVVDTGVTSFIFISFEKAEKDLKLKRAGEQEIGTASLADGSRVETRKYEAYIEWFGEKNRKIVANATNFCPEFLLGMGLLNYKTIKLQGETLKIEPNTVRNAKLC